VLESGFAAAGVPVEVIGTRGSVPQRIVRLAKRLRTLRPDVLHTHNPQAHLHGAWAARLASVPAVVHTRHGRDRVRKPVLAALSRIATAWTDRFVAVSEDAATAAREIEKVPAAKLLVIHNGIDLDRFSFDPTAPMLPRNRAVTVGRLAPIKDQATLLRAVRIVCDRKPGFRLDIVGDGPSRPELEALRSEVDLGEAVAFRGYKEDVRPFLSAADFFVLSSISEGICIALLEAMAAGLPAVATDVGGNREVIVRGETGFLTPPQDSEALAQAMLDIQCAPDVLKRMSQSSRTRIEAAFNLRHVVHRYEDLYRQCLAGRPLESGT
jgi:glycosyltransferase involved in cell wall biosynthesis